MKHRVLLTSVAGSAVAAVLVAGSARPASPQEPEPALTVVARGLDNPRGLAFGPDGALYVAEAGRAGPCRGKGMKKLCFGFTSRITRVKGGIQKRFARGFLSVGEQGGGFSVGIDDVDVDARGRVYAIMASAPIPNPERVLGTRGARQLGRLFRISPTGGTKTRIADVGGFELRRNPDRMDVNPNPYGLTVAGDRIAVVDAGGNTLLRVFRSGAVSLIAVLPPRKVGKELVQSVPTTVARGPDGAYYVGELGGDKMPRGGARIWRIAPGRKPAEIADGFDFGFDTIVGIDFAPDGSLYVAELLRNGFEQLRRRDFSSTVHNLSPEGELIEVHPGRFQAIGGIAVGPDGAVYVSTNSLSPGRGQVIRIAREVQRSNKAAWP